MKVSSNRIGDVRRYYHQRLAKMFPEREADSFVFHILMEFTGYSKAEILMKHDEPISESQLLNVHFAIEDLEKEKPIQYVLGKTEFYGLPFIVNTKVLIPRPETEELVDRVLKTTNPNEHYNILDIGTGSGCIAIALKKNLSDANVMAIDISEFALEVAKQNAVLNHVEVAFKKCDISDRGNWASLKNFDIIVSNPPYVRNSEKKEMKKNVLEYEPSIALFVPDDDPLMFYRYIAHLANEKLNNKGLVFCEINQYLADETQNLFAKKGFKNIEVFKDLYNNFRILSCTKV